MFLIFLSLAPRICGYLCFSDQGLSIRSPTPGTYYIGVYGQSYTQQGDSHFRVKVSLACPRSCGAGVCTQDFTCQCGTRWLLLTPLLRCSRFDDRKML